MSEDRLLLLPQRVAALAASNPDALAIVNLDGEQLTNRELHEESLRYAAAMDAEGIRPGDYVVTMVPNSIAAYTVWLGTSWLGAVEVPLNPALRGPMLRHNVNASQARVAIISSQFLPQLLEVADSVPGLHTVIVLDADEPPELPWHTVAGRPLLASVEPARGLTGPEEWDTCAIIFTSGTSGPSKPVDLPWGALTAALDAPGLNDTTGPGEGFYGSFPAFHISGKASLEMALTHGGRLIFRRQFSPTRFLDDVRANGVTGALLIGAMAQFLLNQPERPDDADTTLKRVILNPTPLAVEEFRRRFGVVTSTEYGTTECMRVCASLGYDPLPPSSCGHPIDDKYRVEARIVDEYDQEVPVGEIGELIVRSGRPWTMFKGYLGMPEATLTAMRNGWYHTGDAMRRDSDGYFYFVDRIKDALRRRGENISSFEVEAFVNEHPAVAETAAIGLPSQETQHENELKIFVIPHENQVLEPADLYSFLQQTMPRFMLPRYVEIVPDFPRTVTAKVQKVALRERGITTNTWDSVTEAIVALPAEPFADLVFEQR